MAATATMSRSSSPNPSVVLRAARLEAQKKQLNRTPSGKKSGLNTQPLSAQPSPREAQLGNNTAQRWNASRHTAERYANAGASTPTLQEMSASLRDGDTSQEEDADTIDQQAEQIANESDAAETMQLAARARSRAKSANGDASQKIAEQVMKKGEELMAEVQAEVLSKSGVLDEGEFLLIPNTALTGMSVIRSIMGVLSKSLKKYDGILRKVGLPIPKHLKWIGGAGTIGEVILYMTVVFVILYIITFLVLAYGTVGSVLHGDITNAYTLMKAAL